MLEEERSLSGSPIYRHKTRKIPFQHTSGDGEIIEPIERHIEKHLGRADNVLHEIVSDLVHIDIHVVPPRPERPFYTLVTSGMSEAPMTTPAEASDWRFAEVMICLPATWDLGIGAATDPANGPLADENNYWPVRLLKWAARLPHEYDTWLGYGHTVGNGDPPAPFSPATKMDSVILLPSMKVPKEFWTLESTSGRTTHFWSLWPLYGEEVAFKMKYGADPLWDKLVDAGVTDLLDPSRANTCRKKWLGLF